MNTIRVFGRKFLFGIVESPPELPKGWSYVMDKSEFVVARNLEGEEYVLTEDHLYPIIGSDTRDTRIDTRCAIPINPQQQ